MLPRTDVEMVKATIRQGTYPRPRGILGGELAPTFPADPPTGGPLPFFGMVSLPR